MQKESNKEQDLYLNILEKLPSKPESIAVTLFIIAMGAYYFWRLIYLTPWYDELYTYYTFISRGPVYAAIHWPVPNNHVGYSVLSAILNFCGNSYIGLRGISFVCAITNLVLIYKIARRYLSYWMPFATVLIYSGFRIVNDLSVQGRGYTLSTTCFLVAILCMTDICMLSNVKKSTYVFFVISLFYGLYTVPTSVYWVIPLCIAGGIYLIINGFRTGKLSDKSICVSSYIIRLKRLVIAGLIAAMITVILYSIIWLAIGCNYLTDDPTSAFYGTSHFYALLHAPFLSYTTGIHLMTSTSYIQGSGRDGILLNMPGYFIYLYNYFLNGFGALLCVLALVALIILLVQCIRHFQYSKTLLNLIYICCMLFVPVMLFVQGNLPYLYLRIFSYMAFLLAYGITNIFEFIINHCNSLYNRKRGYPEKTQGTDIIYTDIVDIELTDDNKWYESAGIYIPFAFVFICFCLIFMRSEYHGQLGDREHYLFEALSMADVGSRESICVTDFEEQYLLKFAYGIDCENTAIEGSDMVIIDKCMLTDNYYGADAYLFFVNHDSIPWDYVNNTLIKIYENEEFVLYVK